MSRPDGPPPTENLSLTRNNLQFFGPGTRLSRDSVPTPTKETKS